MEEKISFHVTRIILTIIFIILSSFIFKSANTSEIASNSFIYNNSKINELSLVELSDGILLKDAYPTKDEVGSKNKGYSFKIVNNTKEKKKVKVMLINTLDDSYDILDNKFIRYQIIKNNEVFIDYSTISDDGTLFIDEIDKEDIYTLKMWISYDATNEVMNKYFSSVIALS